MKAVFRVDASLEMGSGHVMRCLTLAGELSRRGFECSFISRRQSGDLTDTIKAHGYVVHELPESEITTDTYLTHGHWLKGGQQRDARETEAVLENLIPDWLVVDHYGIDEVWERQLRGYVKKILVIDDLADRKHDCDVLIDQNLGQESTMYRPLVSKGCLILTGCLYALLRSEFIDYRQSSLEYRKGKTQIDRVLVTMGGVDKDNHTEKALNALTLSTLDDKTEVKVVLGKEAPWFAEVKKQAEKSRLNVQVKSNVSNMAELMSQSDFAIGAAGSTSWERCCLGLPTLMCVLADNQRGIAEALMQSGAAVFVAEDVENLRLEINRFKQSSQKLELISAQAASLVDGLGTERVATEMEKIL
ncbi:UDP-2,4-diacetamido-2,4,6-trideoxy-beta-L-altropyranose hydrolase [Idiomarina sp. HB]|uniref:UDP-2,4-diacetamido-2,4, 6-trideoxy-beta-L-altropyranose hydrolase n=1 Tax=Idiomarina sp. HB TaxID=3110479 RepID=UPI003A80AFBA